MLCWESFVSVRFSLWKKNHCFLRVSVLCLKTSIMNLRLSETSETSATFCCSRISLDFRLFTGCSVRLMLSFRAWMTWTQLLLLLKSSCFNANFSFSWDGLTLQWLKCQKQSCYFHIRANKLPFLLSLGWIHCIKSGPVFSWSNGLSFWI